MSAKKCPKLEAWRGIGQAVGLGADTFNKNTKLKTMMNKVMHHLAEKYAVRAIEKRKTMSRKKMEERMKARVSSSSPPSSVTAGEQVDETTLSSSNEQEDDKDNGEDDRNENGEDLSCQEEKGGGVSCLLGLMDEDGRRRWEAENDSYRIDVVVDATSILFGPRSRKGEDPCEDNAKLKVCVEKNREGSWTRTKDRFLPHEQVDWECIRSCLCSGGDDLISFLTSKGEGGLVDMCRAQKERMERGETCKTSSKDVDGSRSPVVVLSVRCEWKTQSHTLPPPAYPPSVLPPMMQHGSSS